MRWCLCFLAVLSLAACGTRLNPLNWFGGAENTPRVETEAEASAPLSPTAGLNLISQVTDLSVDPLPSGAIITATGRPPRQGFWQAELINMGVQDGVVAFAFVISEPGGPTAEGTPSSREVVTATALSNQALAEIRAITVVAQANQLTSRR
ncbi:MAG: hypothetical protein AAF965_00515 [Pseudomonadota bacterium]